MSIFSTMPSQLRSSSSSVSRAGSEMDHAFISIGGKLITCAAVAQASLKTDCSRPYSSTTLKPHHGPHR